MAYPYLAECHTIRRTLNAVIILPAAEPIPHCFYGCPYGGGGPVRIPVIRHHAPQVLVFLIFIFYGSLQPVLAIQVHHNAALVEPVMAVRKICPYYKGEIFFFRLHLQDRGIVISEMVVCPLPQICSGLCPDYDFLTANFIIKRFIAMFGVRYIAINDNVDTDSSESNELMPFKNLFNEWYVRDSSRKVRAVLKAKAERGERLGTRAPYGYKKDEADSKRLVVDEEAAAIVRRIFAMCAAGRGPSQIARKLSEEQVLCPTTYAYQKFGVGHVSLDLEKPCHWTDSTIANMLENELYLGNTVNMRFSSKILQGQAEGGTPQRGMSGIRGDAPRLGDAGGLGYRSAGTAKPAPSHQDERAEQVLRAGGVRRLRIHDGAAPGAHDEAHLE